MLTKAARFLLAMTALSPVGFTYAWVAFIQGQHLAGSLILGISLVLVALCMLMLDSAPKALGSSDFKANSVESADHENTAFMLLYAMPLFTSQFNTLAWEFWIPALLIIGIITATSYGYQFNPLLSLMGWHFYKVQSKEGVAFVLITKKQLRTAAAPLKVGQLTEFILLDLERS